MEWIFYSENFMTHSENERKSQRRYVFLIRAPDR